MCLVLSLPDVMLFVLDNKASVARHANDRQDFTLLEQDQPMADRQDFTLLEQDQPMAEEEEEGMRGSERRKYYNGKDNERRWTGTRRCFINQAAVMAPTPSTRWSRSHTRWRATR